MKCFSLSLSLLVINQKTSRIQGISVLSEIKWNSKYGRRQEVVLTYSYQSETLLKRRYKLSCF